MLDRYAALNRFDELMQNARNALEAELIARENPNKFKYIFWFDSTAFITQMQNFLNEALANDSSFIAAEDMSTGAKVELSLEEIYNG